MLQVDTVYTVASVSIPARSEALLPVSSTLRRNGNFLIKPDIQARCSALAVARTRQHRQRESYVPRSQRH